VSDRLIDRELRPDPAREAAVDADDGAQRRIACRGMDQGGMVACRVKLGHRRAGFADPEGNSNFRRAFGKPAR